MNKQPSLLSLVAETIFVIFLIWITFILLTKRVPYIFIDNVNLLIHEAGHIIFSVFGEFIEFLGGSLMQLIIPTSFSIYFFIKKDIFALLFSSFWFGENLINISYYIADARYQVLPLIGGGRHDWAYLLSKTNLLNEAESLGVLVFWTGAIIMLVSLILSTFYVISNFVYFKLQ